MAVCNKGRDDGIIKEQEVKHTYPQEVEMGVCKLNFVLFMPSSLPLLHTAMPTPCLNTFWHSDPYIFLHFLGNVFFALQDITLFMP